jgi:hypothetical protein
MDRYTKGNRFFNLFTGGSVENGSDDLTRRHLEMIDATEGFFDSRFHVSITATLEDRPGLQRIGVLRILYSGLSGG